MSRFTTTGSWVAPDHHALQRVAGKRVDLLVRDVGRHVDEVAGIGFGHELQPLAPAHARAPPDHVDDALQVPVVVAPVLA